MSDIPNFPLLGSQPTADTRLKDPKEKISDVYLDDIQQFSLLGQPPTSVTRKRPRQDPMSDSFCDIALLTLEGGEVATSKDSEGEEGHNFRLPKRRLTEDTATIPVAPLHSSVDDGAIQESPRLFAPSLIPASAALCEVEDSALAQQLVLPLPLASPIQSARDKPPHSTLEMQMTKVPTSQGELIDLINSLGKFVSTVNKSHLLFTLLQQHTRLLLSSLREIIQVSLNHDILTRLPLEISLNIISLLDLSSIISVARVCRNWYSLVCNPKPWLYMLRQDNLIASSEMIDKELEDPNRLMMEWGSQSPHLQQQSYAQVLYKKRCIILKRWMDSLYEPKRISVAGHGTNIVTCLQHDDEKVITGFSGKIINVHSTRTGELLRLLKGHDGGVWALKYFSNTLVSGSTDREVRVWNIRTGHCSHVFKGHTSTVRCLDILHPVQIGSDENGKPIIFPEVPLLVTGSRDHNLHVWKLPLDNESDDCVKETQVYDSKDAENPYLVSILSGHTNSVRTVTGYGNIIISGSYDTTVRVWDLLDMGKCKHVLEGHTDKIYTTTLNFATRRCFSGSMDESINVWDIDTGKLLYSLEGHKILVGLLELSKNYLVSAAADSTLRVWDPKTGENLSKLKGHNSAITCFQHDALKIVSGSERMLKLWDIKTGKFVRDLLSDITGSIWQVSFDLDRCVAAVQTKKNDAEETYIEILDFSTPLNNTS